MIKESERRKDGRGREALKVQSTAVSVSPWTQSSDLTHRAFPHCSTPLEETERGREGERERERDREREGGRQRNSCRKKEKGPKKRQIETEKRKERHDNEKADRK